MTGQLKKVIGLYRRSQRVRYEQAVVEGRQAVGELLSSAPELIRDVYVTQEALETHSRINGLLLDVDPYTHILPAELFEQVSKTAQGVLAVIDIPDEVPLSEVLASAPNLIVGAIEMSDPGNLGTIIRSADATGADAVVLGRGSAEATNPKVIRSTAGSIFHLPVLEDEDMADVVGRAREAGLQILIADGAGEVELGSPDLDLTKPTMWLLGNEAHGFTDEQKSWADRIVRIPMWGRAESLNVAMATTICLYASASAQNAPRA